MDRQRRANTPENYDEKGRVNKADTTRLRWRERKQKQYGKSMGLRAPGLCVAHVRRLGAQTGGSLLEVSPSTTKLSQECHRCRHSHKKPRSQRWQHCPCGFGPVQRDLDSAFLLAYLEPEHIHPSITQQVWAGAGLGGEPRRLTVLEDLQPRANEGQIFPPSAWA
jgi:hypothetical protein